MTQAEFDELKKELFVKVTEMILDKIIANPILMKDNDIQEDYVARLLKVTDSYTDSIEDFDGTFDVQDFLDRLDAVEIIENKQ